MFHFNGCTAGQLMQIKQIRDETFIVRRVFGISLESIPQ
jgi:hypothetical protein